MFNIDYRCCSGIVGRKQEARCKLVIMNHHCSDFVIDCGNFSLNVKIQILQRLEIEESGERVGERWASGEKKCRVLTVYLTRSYSGSSPSSATAR